MVAEALRTGAKMLYSDEDKIAADGTLSEPHLKPDWKRRLSKPVRSTRPTTARRTTT
jgi:hypothetical protein